MKEHPILFKPELVRAILGLGPGDPKTQTRRVVTAQNTDLGRREFESLDLSRAHADRSGRDYPWYLHAPAPDPFDDDGDVWPRVFCRMEVGHRLWVREPWARIEPYPTTMSQDVGLPALHYSEWTPKLWAYWTRRIIHRATHVGDPPDRWRPSIHMPRWACRLVLPLVEVRVERLQDISDDDIRAEGVTIELAERRARLKPGTLTTLRAAWAVGWDSINGKRPGCSWESNPWVWVLRWEAQSILTGEDARPQAVAA